MKTQEDLYLEYARCITMTREYNEKHGTDVKPWECVKWIDGEIVITFIKTPSFDGLINSYAFALTILEVKAVFVGDKIYPKRFEAGCVIADTNRIINEENFTWTPPTPKRTFMLNGVELPCPVITRGRIQSDRHIRSIEFEFDSAEEGDTFITRLNELLTEARDKE